MAEEDVVKKSLANILKTQDEQEQVATVEKLIQLANAPVISMTVVLDTRTGTTDILLNGRFSFDEIYTLLDMTRREVNRRERDAILQQQQQPSQA